MVDSRHREKIRGKKKQRPKALLAIRLVKDVDVLSVRLRLPNRYYVDEYTEYRLSDDIRDCVPDLNVGGNLRASHVCSWEEVEGIHHRVEAP